MMDKYILIDNGVAVISSALLVEFPEMEVVINGNEVTVKNVWREDFVSVVSDNVFWANSQEFLSFSIIFDDDNATDVDTLSNLLVRYVNFHDGDYDINIPKYADMVSKITDPLQLGLKPNYYGSLSEYKDGMISIAELSNSIMLGYLYAIPEEDISAMDIEMVIASIPMADIIKFLESDVTVMETYNTINDNSELDGTGNKTYTLDTATRELTVVENNNEVKVTRVCSPSEDISDLIPSVIANSSTITRCVLKNLTCTQFTTLAQQDLNIITDFGASVQIVHDGVIKMYFTAQINTRPSLVSEFLADVLMLAGNIPISFIESSGVGTYYLDGVNSISGTDNMFIYISEVIRIMRERVVALSNNGDTSKCPLILSPTIIYARGLSESVPINILETAEDVACTVEDTYQFFYAPNISDISTYSSPVDYFEDGVFKINNLSLLGYLGTPLESKVTEVRIQDFSILIEAVKKGISPIVYREFTSIANNELVGLTKSGFNVDNCVALIDAGVTRFDYLHSSYLLGVQNKGISAQRVTYGSLLFASLSETLSAGSGYFESGVEVEELGQSSINTQHFFAIFFNALLPQIHLNGVSITDKEGILTLLIGNDTLRVSSVYHIRDKDLLLYKSVFDLLREGYRKHFRISNNTDDILDTQNEFSFAMLENVYNTLFGNTINQAKAVQLAKFVSLAQGDTIYFSRGVQNGLTLPPIPTTFKIGLSLGGWQKEAFYKFRTLDIFEITYTGGTFTVEAFRTMEDYVGNGGTYYLEHIIDGDIITVVWMDQRNGTRFLSSDSFDTKTMTRTTSKVYASYETDPRPTPPTPTIPQVGVIREGGSYVHYTFTQGSNGETIVDYIAYDKDGNDITDDYKTISFGDRLVHKEIG